MYVKFKSLSFSLGQVVGYKYRDRYASKYGVKYSELGKIWGGRHEEKKLNPLQF